MSEETRKSDTPQRGPGSKMKVAQKPDNMKKAFADLIHFSRRSVPAIIIAFVLAIAGTILALIGPNKLKDITNIVFDGLALMRQGNMSGIDMDAVRDIGTTLIILYLLSGIFSYVQSFIMTTVTQKITRELRTSISNKINKVPLNYYNKTSFGDVLSRVTNDIDLVGQTLNMSISQLVTAVTMFIGSLVMMIYTNWIMALTAVGTTVIGFVLMGIIMAVSQKHFVRQQAELGRINGHVEEIYTGHNVVKVYNGTYNAEKTFDEINEKLYESAWKSQFLSGIMMPIMNFIGNLGYVAICVVGALQVINDGMDFGVIVAFMVYIRLFTNPLSQIAQAATSLQTTAAASERIFALLSEDEMADESSKTTYLAPEKAKGDVEFRNVQFGYVPEKTIIHNFSAHAKAGQKIAIVGPTGAGKTTMVNLLMRFYELNRGQILIDGIPTSELTRENVHELFCMVLQDTWLFEGTIRENIVYSKKGVTDDEIKAACKAVGINHFIKTLPDGYDTVLNDKASLSAGQKQLITIARAMIENAPLLILDEATSSVDTRTELQIQEAMDKLTVGRTSFVIAHRLSTIKNADLILVMKDGDIIESGNHTELLEKKGFYADLYNSQFEQAS